jgi:hypothetical protein
MSAALGPAACFMIVLRQSSSPVIAMKLNEHTYRRLEAYAVAGLLLVVLVTWIASKL